MAITYTWTIETCEHDIATGGINVVHYRCTGVEGENSCTSYGTVDLTPDPSAADFVAYADVTEAQAKAWVWGGVSQDDTEAFVADQIGKMVNPTAASGTPWAA